MPLAVKALQRRLLAWHAGQRRQLPWRDVGDPYAVLVSEVMLQQTQAARVVPAYTRFLRRYPTVAALAAAPLADVLTAWQGLGYNRRARSLHRAAQVIVRDHGGAVPAELAALEELPGVGPYTARAVLAFAFGRHAAPVDTNVARVLARAVAGAPLSRGDVQRLADRLVPAGRAGAWASAVMDLGAGVCTARRPRCESCPLVGGCAWRAGGGPEHTPDPAGSLTRSQTPFAGSDRYHRGRLLDALREGPLPAAGVARAARLDDPDRAARLAGALAAEGLAEWCDGLLRLPL